MLFGEQGNMRHKSRQRPKAPRTAPYFPSLQKHDLPNTNVDMFAEDVHRAVMPIGGRPRWATNFSVEIQGNSENETRATEILESLTGHPRYSPAELLSSAVKRIAGKLARNGHAVYQIVRDEKNGEAWRLHGFTSQRLFRFFGRYIQIIPKADRRPTAAYGKRPA